MSLTKGESPTVFPGECLVPLGSILFTEELHRRTSRPPDYERENRALTALVQALANSPGTILQTLADAILELFQAGSAGISVLTKDKARFYWPAIAGEWKSQIGGGTPRDLGPCGNVLDRNTPLLFKRPERHYTYLQEATPLIEECLLVPFNVKGKAVGTLWAIAHDDRRQFDAEDLRQLESLGRFAAAAYQAVAAQEATDSARAVAGTLLEDAVQSRHLAETLNVKLHEEIIERQETEDQVRLSKQNLAVELAATQRLYEVSTQLIQADDVEKLYDTILDTAVSIMHSDFASLQMFHPERGAGGELQLLGSRGFNPQAVKFWEWVGIEGKSSCAAALRTGHRCIMPNVRKGNLATGIDFEAYLHAGIHAAQTTPLLSRAGALIGMISTHWGTAHVPTESEWCLIDILARQAADLIERKQVAAALRQSEARFRALFDLRPIGIYSIDADGLIQESNAVAAQLWGREPKRGDPIDRYCASHELYLPDGTPMSHEQTPMVGVLRGEIPEVRDAEVVIGRPDGSRVTVIANIVPLRNDRGEITGVMNCFYDITQRKRAENALRESEEFNRSIIESSPDCIKTLDLKGNLLSMQNGQELMGISDIRPFLNKSWIELWDSGVQPTVRAAVEGAAAGEDKNFVAFFATLAGQPKWWDVTVTPILDANGQPVRLLAVSRDVTRRHQQEEALRESEERYRTLFNSMDEGYCIIEMIFDEHGKAVDYLFLETNASFIKQCGIQDAVGKRMREIAPNHEEHWFEIYGNVVKTGEAIRFVHHAKELGASWFELYAFQLGGRESAKVGVTFVNITERMKAEAALRDSEERYRNLFDSIDEGFCVIEMIYDEQGQPIDYTFLETNPAFERQSGLSQAKGRRALELVPNLERHWPQMYGKVARTGEPIRIVSEVKSMNRWLDVYGCRVGGPESRKVAVVFNDISERKQAEAALLQSREEISRHAATLEEQVIERTTELTATNQQLEAFVYTIAHDLRAPLRSMQGFAAMLVEEAGTALSPTGRDFANRINKSAKFMDALLQDLLAFSCIAQEQIQLKAVNLETSVQSVLARLEGEIQEKNGRVEIAGPWPTVLAHETTLDQVLTNLISNAVKFAAPGTPPHIRLRAEEHDGFIRVWVEDNGIGVAPYHQSQIFRLFTRLHGDKFPGTGIGLAIVQKGVERMSGNVGLESAPDQGSRFWFTLRPAGKK